MQPHLGHRIRARSWHNPDRPFILELAMSGAQCCPDNQLLRNCHLRQGPVQFLEASQRAQVLVNILFRPALQNLRTIRRRFEGDFQFPVGNDLRGEMTQEDFPTQLSSRHKGPTIRLSLEQADGIAVPIPIRRLPLGLAEVVHKAH